MSSEIFVKTISDILAIPIKDITVNLAVNKTPQWGSVETLLIVSDLEEELKVEFTLDEVISIKTLKDIIEILKKKGIHVHL